MGIIFNLIVDLISFTLYFTFPNKILTYKRNKKWLTITLIAVNLLIATIVRLNLFLYANPIKTLIYISLYAVYIYFSYEERIKEKATAYVLLLLSIITSDMLTIVILSAFNIDYSMSVNGIPGNLISNCVCLVLTYIFMFVISLIYNKIKHKNASNSMWQFQIIIISQILFASVACFSIFMSNSLESLIMKTPGFAVLLLLTMAVAIVGDVCLYRILLTNSQNFELKRELELLETKEKLELEYYEKLRKNVAETRKLNHDFSNAIAVIEGIINSDDIQENRRLATEVVDEIKETLKKNKVRNYCENELVNLIVINKSEEISQTGADFSANLDIPQNINIKSFDLCRIFTNLLDNANEACLLTKDKEKCFVVLSAEIKDDFLYITCENYYDSELSIKKDKLLSTKENHKGLGLEIIKEIAKDYCGEYILNCRNNIFTLTVSLKNNRQEN